MKVIIEVSNKIFNLASSMIMAEVEKEETEKKLEEIIEKMKTLEEPYYIDLEKVDNKDVKSRLPMAIAMLAITQEISKD